MDSLWKLLDGAEEAGYWRGAARYRDSGGGGGQELCLCRAHSVEKGRTDERFYVNAKDIATIIKLYSARWGSDEIIKALS